MCTHTGTEGKQRKARDRNILKSLEKTQYLMNYLYVASYQCLTSLLIPFACHTCCVLFVDYLAYIDLSLFFLPYLLSVYSRPYPWLCLWNKFTFCCYLDRYAAVPSFMLPYNCYRTLSLPYPWLCPWWYPWLDWAGEWALPSHHCRWEDPLQMPFHNWQKTNLLITIVIVQGLN